MPKFSLHIHCDNAAFADAQGNVTPESAANELAVLLRVVALRLERGDYYDKYRTIHDTNGNDVGRFAIKED